MREAIGETEFEHAADPRLRAGRARRLVQAAPCRPTRRSALVVVDAKGRALQTHLNWIQVRPGERRTCDGCHSPRRGGAINSGAVVNAMPAALMPALAARAPVGRDDGRDAHAPRPERAGARHRHGLHRLLGRHDASPASPRAPSIDAKYTGNANPADDLATRGADQRHHQLSAITSRRSGRAAAAPAAPTPAPTATTTRPSSTCARRSPAPAAWPRTRSCCSAIR